MTDYFASTNDDELKGVGVQTVGRKSKTSWAKKKKKKFI